MRTSGKISLIIRDESLDFDLIESLLLVKATKAIKKGQFISKSRIAKCDIWKFDIKLNSLDDFESKMEQFLDTFLEAKIAIFKLQELYNHVGVVFSLSSEYGQLGFSLTSVLLKKISELELEIAFDIISFGKVED